MSARQIVERSFAAALADAAAEGIAADTLARAMLSRVIAEFLAHRPLKDVQSELIAAADNADPDRDFMFMRP